jgi:hypothetical protein
VALRILSTAITEQFTLRADFRLDFIDVKINCTGGDPAELCFSATVNYLITAMPACDITSSCDPVPPFTPIAPLAAATS